MINPTPSETKPTAIVTGGTRGLGRGIAQALLERGMRVIALSPHASPRDPGGIEQVAGDAADERTAGRLLQDLQPELVVLCGGAAPLLRPIHLHSWETFSLNWEVDTKAAFVWLRNALLLPAKPGSHIVLVSSMAAVHGSPLSGSYAGAKRMMWLLAEYAREECRRLERNLAVHCLLPMLNPSTALGQAAMKAYAERAGMTPEDMAKRVSPPLTPEIIGQAVVELHGSPESWNRVAYRIGGDGLVAID
jgi:NAD(P)-dependent dehydrogenase (short-subunit alcohol dehydrogenase family)